MNLHRSASLAFLTVGLVIGGCGQKDGEASLARTPAEAASQLESSFAGAAPEAQAGAHAAAEALRTDNYEQAVVSLGTVRAAPKVTVEQGLAIHSSVVNLEGRLVRAIESGDPKAKRAYELLKAMKRK
jgi:hypothetical protein